ncbi:MFS transporter [Leptothrix ochracea]|uniref:MFS transporter n=1 Tax=Leptothrix ochracea TaxID=735331 RepID=UPI0034E2FD25
MGLAALFASTFCELCGLFMFGPLLLFTLKARGLDTAEVGLISASQWLGMVLATPFTAGWVRRLGPQGALQASGVVPLLALLGITLSTSAPLWAGLYLIAGAAGALRWIVAESTVAELAPAAWRGRIVGLYETMVGATFVLGPALLALIGTEGAGAEASRWTALALVALGVLLTALVPKREHPADEDVRLGWHGIFDALRAAPAVMVVGFVGGFFEAGLASLLPLFGLAHGFPVAQAALLVSASGLGSALMMVPVGLAADRWSLERIWRWCARVNLCATLLLPLVGLFPAAHPLAWGIAFAWGGAGGALYTLAMVDIGHRHQGVALVNATAVLVMSYTLGGLCAPAFGASALQFAPIWGLPILLSLVAGLGLRALVKH